MSEYVEKISYDAVLESYELLSRQYDQLLVDSKIIAYALIFHPKDPNAAAIAAALLDPPDNEEG